MPGTAIVILRRLIFMGESVPNYLNADAQTSSAHRRINLARTAVRAVFRSTMTINPPTPASLDAILDGLVAGSAFASQAAALQNQ
jgi:hypothetical protein